MSSKKATGPESGTPLGIWITAAEVVVGIAAGWFHNSVASLADGLHVSTYADGRWDRFAA